MHILCVYIYICNLYINGPFVMHVLFCCSHSATTLGQPERHPLPPVLPTQTHTVTPTTPLTQDINTPMAGDGIKWHPISRDDTQPDGTAHIPLEETQEQPKARREEGVPLWKAIIRKGTTLIQKLGLHAQTYLYAET